MHLEDLRICYGVHTSCDHLPGLAGPANVRFLAGACISGGGAGEREEKPNAAAADAVAEPGMM